MGYLMISNPIPDSREIEDEVITHKGSEYGMILMDGDFRDWDELESIYSDPKGDKASGVLDFGSLKVVNDHRFLYLLIDIGTELNLQDNNQITLYLDSDLKSDTGMKQNGIGAELKWIFGKRYGSFINGKNSNDVKNEHIGLYSAPTVSSAAFEIAIERNSELFDKQLFPEDSFYISIMDDEGGDMIPNSNELIMYTFNETQPSALQKISLDREDETDFRIMSYNVLQDNLFDTELFDTYDRIISAIEPDIIGFQELYGHSANETAMKVEEMLPSGENQSWYSSKINPDIVVVSRFPIQESYKINRSGAFVINITSGNGSYLLLINAHLSAGDKNIERQIQIDQLMAFIRDMKNPGGIITLTENTPFIVMGDLNLVGYSQQLETLLNGAIINSEYSPSFLPDWDSSPLTDLKPRHTDSTLYFTWYDESSTYWPGRLDYIIYSDSVLQIDNQFVLFTPDMSDETLTECGLKYDDVILASDHLPIVADFALI
jgi:endonuclease/exonuclease/phosphatase family metal-dependent hydrolase